MHSKVRRRDHHLYAIQFDDGTVKIGRSVDPKRRIQGLAGDHRKEGLTVLRTWVSEPMRYADALDVEYALKERCARQWAVAHGTEYLADADLDEVVVVASELTKQLLSAPRCAYTNQRLGLRRLRKTA
jgi:predicted GIY-YIG superfamily endonuclease